MLNGRHFFLSRIFHASISSHLYFFSFVIASMFPELVLVHGRWSFYWGWWQNAISFYLFTSFSHSALLLLSVGKSVDAFAPVYLCMCGESWAYCLSQNTVATVPALHSRGICPHPSYLLLCVCHRSILFTTSSLLPILPLGCNNTEPGWEGCPVPTFRVSHSQRDIRTQTLSTHAQSCFIVWFATELKWFINSLTYCGIVQGAKIRSW